MAELPIPHHFDDVGACYVYFFQRSDKAIKIGLSHNVEKRRRVIEGSTGPLVQLAVISGDRGVERNLHWLYRKSRMHGEWFYPTLDLLTHIYRVRTATFADADYNNIGRYNRAAPEAKRRMKGYRLCLGCMEDWTYSEGPLCPACSVEHELHKQAKGTWSGDVAPAEWWGLTLKDIAPEDLAEGFYIASASGDMPLYGQPEEDYA